MNSNIKNKDVNELIALQQKLMKDVSVSDIVNETEIIKQIKDIDTAINMAQQSTFKIRLITVGQSGYICEHQELDNTEFTVNECIRLADHLILSYTKFSKESFTTPAINSNNLIVFENVPHGKHEVYTAVMFIRIPV